MEFPTMGYDIYWNVTQWTFSSPIIACLNFLGQNKFGNSMLQNLTHVSRIPTRRIINCCGAFLCDSINILEPNHYIVVPVGLKPDCNLRFHLGFIIDWYRTFFKWLWKHLRLKQYASITTFIFFSVRERAVFYKSCNLIGSESGQYSPHPACSRLNRFFSHPFVRF